MVNRHLSLWRPKWHELELKDENHVLHIILCMCVCVCVTLSVSAVRACMHVYLSHPLTLTNSLSTALFNSLKVIQSINSIFVTIINHIWLQSPLDVQTSNMFRIRECMQHFRIHLYIHGNSIWHRAHVHAHRHTQFTIHTCTCTTYTARADTYYSFENLMHAPHISIHLGCLAPLA